MNPMTPPFAPTISDGKLIPEAYPDPPTVESGPHDTANLLYLARGMDPTIRRLAQEVLAYRWANCQANK